jgi:hypothetical protein
VTADEFGFDPCRADTERGWPCTQAAIDDSQLCRWHMKVARKMIRRVEPESKAAPASRKKATS